jgi:mono/diheme cytochrome c family protein
MRFLRRVMPLALLACVALALGACGGGDDSGSDATTTEAATTTTEGGGAAGKEVFVSNCGGCHTLSAAGTSGTTGPNLDDLQPDEATVEQQVRNGGGGMPAFEGKLSDEQISAVASYVAGNAGS